MTSSRSLVEGRRRFTYIRREISVGRIIKSVRVESQLDGPSLWTLEGDLQNGGIDRSVYDDLFGNGRRPKLYSLIAIRTESSMDSDFADVN